MTLTTRGTRQAFSSPALGSRPRKGRPRSTTGTTSPPSPQMSSSDPRPRPRSRGSTAPSGRRSMQDQGQGPTPTSTPRAVTWSSCPSTSQTTAPARHHAGYAWPSPTPVRAKAYTFPSTREQRCSSPSLTGTLTGPLSPAPCRMQRPRARCGKRTGP